MATNEQQQLKAVAELPILMSGEMVRATLAGRKTQTRRILNPQPIPVRDLSLRRQQKKGDLFIGPDLLPTTDKKNLVFGVALGPGTTRCVGSQVLCEEYCPYGGQGANLWVRETWRTSVICDDRRPADMEKPGRGFGWPVWYLADNAINLRGRDVLAGGPGFTNPGRTRVSIHMPRWASRITLEITEVRVERLQDISEADAIAEGIGKYPPPDDQYGYKYYGKDLERLMQCTPNPKYSYQSLWEKINGAGSWDLNPWVWVIGFKVAKQEIESSKIHVEAPSTNIQAPENNQASSTNSWRY